MENKARNSRFSASAHHDNQWTMLSLWLFRHWVPCFFSWRKQWNWNDNQTVDRMYPRDIHWCSKLWHPIPFRFGDQVQSHFTGSSLPCWFHVLWTWQLNMNRGLFIQHFKDGRNRICLKIFTNIELFQSSFVFYLSDKKWMNIWFSWSFSGMVMHLNRMYFQGSFDPLCL